jgi:hypothetical protein
MKIQEEKFATKEIAYSEDITKMKKRQKKLSVTMDGFTQGMLAWYSLMGQLKLLTEQKTSSNYLKVNILRQKNLKTFISNPHM